MENRLAGVGEGSKCIAFTILLTLLIHRELDVVDHVANNSTTVFQTRH